MWARTWAYRAAHQITENREFLIGLDRAIGDADHGENLDRGFRAVVDYLDGNEESQADAILRGVGFTLISNVGGASGPLYGSAFIRMADVATDDLTPAAVASMLDRGVAAIQARGHAQAGEKTMVDVWLPVADAVNDAVDQGADITVICDVLAETATAAAQATAPMIATKGRASYLGECTISHIDPGAASSNLILQALLDCVK
ncbi:PTS-dependent dihydroxyacetone kinase, ADP-binding subunit dhaL [Arcanobacterium haemolyticum]|uniref:dihydroxyacetone kinase subunit DhaL n=1 Tax=Arcanobacterium haemolyticum TaxID=28264 RepID=UPI000D928300|nr:dihydroxyacetone kinase subunit DhaL [Arcanobacterium haemolyticum]SPT75240.1 PTS-dependent dihydroxyacetone kinase, ADP-binding subunit dhaL [Arcanobacterium haemolyticum]